MSQQEIPLVFDTIWEFDRIFHNICYWLPRPDQLRLLHSSREMEEEMGSVYYAAIHNSREFLGLLPSDEVRPSGSRRLPFSDIPTVSPFLAAF